MDKIDNIYDMKNLKNCYCMNDTNAIYYVDHTNVTSHVDEFNQMDDGYYSKDMNVISSMLNSSISSIA
jgi:hypothetical protein